MSVSIYHIKGKYTVVFCTVLHVCSDQFVADCVAHTLY